MATINPIDQLFITVRQNGMTRLITELSGVSSFIDIVNCLRNNLPGLNGLTTIMVRNTTEGWSKSQTVFVG